MFMWKMPINMMCTCMCVVIGVCVFYYTGWDIKNVLKFALTYQHTDCMQNMNAFTLV